MPDNVTGTVGLPRETSDWQLQYLQSFDTSTDTGIRRREQFYRDAFLNSIRHIQREQIMFSDYIPWPTKPKKKNPTYAECFAKLKEIENADII